ncbi:MAG: GyrI-like domain-containing protein [Planctomycetes bacterium]|nr:GyrI-like domain-containing protein [Planctomycetota bacterium]
MNAIGVIAIIIAIGIIILLVVLSRYGLFASINISERNVGPYLLVYKKHIGDYKNVAPVMDKLYWDLLDNYAIETTKGFGLYYDNPQEVDKDKLRSVVGCIIEGKSIDDLKKVSEKYSVKEYPSSKSVVAQFPFKGKMSIIMGVFKVYPKLNEYIKGKNYGKTPIMELYDQPNERIEYISSVNLAGDIFNEFLESDK